EQVFWQSSPAGVSPGLLALDLGCASSWGFCALGVRCAARAHGLMTTAVVVAPTGIRIWLLAARPATLPAAVVPVLVGTGAALHGLHQLNLPVLIPTMLVALLIQIGTNFANDVFDFRRGADTAERLGPLRVTHAGLVSAQQVLLATYVTFGLALVIGLYLVAIGGWPILLIGRVWLGAGLPHTGG